MKFLCTLKRSHFNDLKDNTVIMNYQSCLDSFLLLLFAKVDLLVLMTPKGLGLFLFSSDKVIDFPL